MVGFCCPAVVFLMGGLASGSPTSRCAFAAVEVVVAKIGGRPLHGTAYDRLKGLRAASIADIRSAVEENELEPDSVVTLTANCVDGGYGYFRDEVHLVAKGIDDTMRFRVELNGTLAPDGDAVVSKGSP